MDQIIKELKRAARSISGSTTRRDELILKANAQGMSYREIGGHVGLSHPTVRLIVLRAHQGEHHEQHSDTEQEPSTGE